MSGCLYLAPTIKCANLAIEIEAIEQVSKGRHSRKRSSKNKLRTSQNEYKKEKDSFSTFNYKTFTQIHLNKIKSSSKKYKRVKMSPNFNRFNKVHSYLLLLLLLVILIYSLHTTTTQTYAQVIFQAKNEHQQQQDGSFPFSSSLLPINSEIPSSSSSSFPFYQQQNQQHQEFYLPPNRSLLRRADLSATSSLLSSSKLQHATTLAPSSTSWRDDNQLLGGASGATSWQKAGPQFVKEPPSFIHYLNSSDLVIPCVASGNPAPTIVSVFHLSVRLFFSH